VKARVLALLIVAVSLATVGAAAAQPASPTCSVFDQVVVEGNANVAFLVACTNPTPVTERIDFATSDATATDPEDYNGGIWELLVLPGSTDQEVVVDIADDVIPEPEETFLVSLSDPDGVVAFGRQQATGTIQDDDEQQPGPCITLSKTALSGSAPFSTALRREFAVAGLEDRIQLTSCSEDDLGLQVRGTDATGSAGTWALTDASSGGPIDSTCELGTDLYRGSMVIWNDQGGSNEGATLTTQDVEVEGPTGPFVLLAATAREMSIQVEMPCQGSVGLDQPMSMEVVITAAPAP